MKNKTHFSIGSFLFFFLCLLLTSGCEKDRNGEEEDSLPVLSTLDVIQITDTTAISGGKISDDGGTKVTARGICWSINSNPAIDDSKTEDGTGEGSFTSSMYGLEPNTTYYVRAYATNEAGTVYGNELSFTSFETGFGSFTDHRDDNIYQTVTIGNQVWMAENLKYLPSVVPSDIRSETIPYHYVFGYEYISLNEARASGYYKTRGVLYNWAASLVACPSGWRLPSQDDWLELTDYLVDNTGGKLKTIGTYEAITGLWSSPNTDATNETGFSAIPAGFRANPSGFSNLTTGAHWWSSTASGDGLAWGRLIYNFGNTLAPVNEQVTIGKSVRCLKD